MTAYVLRIFPYELIFYYYFYFASKILFEITRFLYKNRYTEINESLSSFYHIALQKRIKKDLLKYF